MTMKCGIVGLPNVGKSTLFNAITESMNAEAANYPFCTIEPNVGRVFIKDHRLYALAKIANSQKIINTFIDILDIAGLVAGASKGEGLGNKFLSNIREVDAILHVVRCFDDNEINHVLNNIDPIRDIQVINTELLLADLETIDKIILNLEKKIKSNKELTYDLNLANKLKASLENDKFIINILDDFDHEEKQIIKTFCLLTAKPIIYIANLDENSIANPMENKYFYKLKEEFKNEKIIPICSKFEMELIALENEDDKKLMLESIGMNESGINKIAKAGYDILNLITFFTIGPKEAHAWQLKNGSLAPNAAGVIHTDFEKGFIKAETISYADFLKYNGEDGVKSAGKIRLEGKDYLVQDGDIMHFKFNI